MQALASLPGLLALHIPLHEGSILSVPPIHIVFITAVEFKLTVVRHTAQLARVFFIEVYVSAVVRLIERLFLCAVIFRLGCRGGSSYFDATASGRVQQLGQVLF